MKNYPIDITEETIVFLDDLDSYIELLTNVISSYRILYPLGLKYEAEKMSYQQVM